MTTATISQLLYLLDQAFEGQEWHSLLGNLRSVTPEDWRWIPPGGRRSIAEIVGVMIQHDLYHAGEINHLRALHQQRDRWPHGDD